MPAYPCPHCGHKIRVAEEQAGKRVRCPSCQGAFAVPTAARRPQPPDAPADPGDVSLVAANYWLDRIADLWPAPAPAGPADAPTLPPDAGADSQPLSSASTLPPEGVMPAVPLPEGVNIPGYEVLGELGRGGMGVVYKARQTALKRMVALKMLSDDANAGPRELARFQAEAQAVARLQHANIVQIYDVNQHEGRHYLSLEFVGGGSLAQRYGGRALPPRTAAALIEPLARAVHHAHQQGIIHRDLKPANVLLAADGTPKITDFGMAKRLDTDSGLTLAGVIVGTPDYMAPEQAAGQTRDIGPATDVYALGAILYELLAGRPPFKGANPLQTLLHVRSQEPAPPSRYLPVPPELEAICLTCLRKDPRERYASAELLADNLQRFLTATESEPVPKDQPPADEGQARQLQRTVAEVRAELHKEREQGRQLQAALATSERQLYACRVALAAHHGQAANPQQAQKLLEECPAALRHWEWHYLHRRFAGGEPAVVRRHGATLFGAALSPDGRQLAVADDTGVRLGDPDTGQEVGAFASAGRGCTALTYSPDGVRFAAVCGEPEGWAGVWDTQTRQPALTVGGRAGMLSGLAFSPDGARLAAAVLGVAEAPPEGRRRPSGIKVWDLATGRAVLALPVAGVVCCVAYSPDGSLVAAGGRTGTAGEVAVWDAAGGPAQRVLRGHTGEVNRVAFSPDGGRLASAGQDGRVRVWDVHSGEELLVLRGHERPVTSLAFSPDGRRLASAGFDETVRLWGTAGEEELLVLRGHSGPVLCVFFDREGHRLITAGTDQTVRVWEAVR